MRPAAHTASLHARLLDAAEPPTPLAVGPATLTAGPATLTVGSATLTVGSATLAVGLAMLIALALPSRALAQPPSSQITTPAGLAYPFGELASTIAVSGTTDIAGEVEVRCYTGTLKSSFKRVAEHVEVAEGHFATEAPVAALGRAPCQLRAVPVKYAEKALPPGEETEFKGPLVVPARFEAQSSTYFVAADALDGSFSFEAAGTFALESELYSASAHEDVGLFFGDADLSSTLLGRDSARSGVEVDGVGAYLPSAALKLEGELREEAKRDKETFAALAGMPSVTVTQSYDEQTHATTIHEEDPVVRCAPNDQYPAKAGRCLGFVSTGVTLVRTWQTSAEDRVALMSDSWRSVDGRAHTVSALYQNELVSTSKEGGAYEFPEEASFLQTDAGETWALPPAGIILYKASAGEGEAGDGVDPQGAIVYDGAPSEPLEVVTGTAQPGEFGQSAFDLGYEQQVPSEGASPPLRMAFVQGFSLGEVRALAEAVLAGLLPAEATAAPEGPAPANGPPSATVGGPPARAAVVGRVSGAGGRVTFTLLCSGPAGGGCSVHALLSTILHEHGRRLVAVSARAARRRRTIARRTILASRTLTIAAGHRVTIPIALDSTGRRLLDRLGKLPVELSVTSTIQGVKSAVTSQNLVVRKARRPRISR